MRCNGDNVCSSCAPGYQLTSTGTCVFDTCKFPCLECDTTNSNLCISCISPPFVSTPNNGRCFSCNTPNCVDCSPTDISQCITCQSGFTLSSNGICTPTCLQAQCTSCSSFSTCTTCVSGYFILLGFCVPCSPGCSSCAQGTDGTLTCNSCTSGFFASGSLCLPCPFFC